jgi:hypothetical protein
MLKINFTKVSITLFDRSEFCKITLLNKNQAVWCYISTPFVHLPDVAKYPLQRFEALASYTITCCSEIRNLSKFLYSAGSLTVTVISISTERTMNCIFPYTRQAVYDNRSYVQHFKRSRVCMLFPSHQKQLVSRCLMDLMLDFSSLCN